MQLVGGKIYALADIARRLAETDAGHMPCVCNVRGASPSPLPLYVWHGQNDTAPAT